MVEKILTGLVLFYAVIGFISSVKWIFAQSKDMKKSMKKGVSKPIENSRENQEF